VHRPDRHCSAIGRAGQYRTAAGHWARRRVILTALPVTARSFGRVTALTCGEACSRRSRPHAGAADTGPAAGRTRRLPDQAALWPEPINKLDEHFTASAATPVPRQIADHSGGPGNRRRRYYARVLPNCPAAGRRRPGGGGQGADGDPSGPTPFRHEQAVAAILVFGPASSRGPHHPRASALARAMPGTYSLDYA